jgi:hypothetical protein
MDPMLLRVFQRHVAAQCRFTLTGVPMINQALKARDTELLWVGCQILISGSGNVSKALWGDGRNRAKVAPVRQPLRDSLNVDDSSPLFELSMRNNFEHFDERIDKWWNEDQHHNIIDGGVISPISAVAGFTDIQMFRNYDETGPTIWFWGQRFDVQPIVDECDRIYPIAMTEGHKPHWHVPPEPTRP